MSNSEPINKKSWKSRLGLAVAGFALAGTLAAGAVAAVDVDPVSADDTTETAWALEATATRSSSIRGYARGLSWQ